MRFFKIYVLIFLLCITPVFAQHGTEKKTNRSGPLLGSTLGIGYLSGLNLLAGYLFDDCGVSVSGLYKIDDSYGVQGSAFYKIYESEHWLHTTGLVAGNSYVPASSERSMFQYNYIGIAYNMHAYNTFWEIAYVKPYNMGNAEAKGILKYLSFQFGVANRFY
jgi:hypothetical protein